MRPLQKGVILGSLLAVLLSYSAAQEGVADVVKKSSDAVVLIVTSNSGGQETALGSGFLISADGEIVTNYHVIKEAHSATVKLSNGAFFPVGGVLASDADKDLAIIKVNGKNLPFLTLGDIDNLRVGDHVVAIGSPLGLEGTVSDGIVSAIRDIAGKKWIQTTAPVSHGNSGGPLLDMSSHVVGVITLGVNLELGQNLNFALPANEASKLLLTARQQAKPLDSVASKSEDSFPAPLTASGKGKKWLDAQKDPAAINVNGRWESEEWGTLSCAYFPTVVETGCPTTLHLRQAEGSREVHGSIGEYEITGVVSGRLLFLLFSMNQSIEYCAVLSAEDNNTLAGSYSYRRSWIKFGHGSPCQETSKPMNMNRR